MSGRRRKDRRWGSWDQINEKERWMKKEYDGDPGR